MLSDPSTESEPRGKPELVVIAKPEAHLQVTAEGIASTSGAPVEDLQQILQDEDVTLVPLVPEASRGPETAGAGETVDENDLSLFYHVEAPEDRLEDLAARLNQSEAIAGAYVKAPAEPAALVLERDEVLSEAEPADLAPPAVTPDFTSRQGYLNAAPVGVDAYHGWGRPGGGGQNIRAVITDFGWNFAHEDLQQNSLGLVCGINGQPSHGTAAAGVLGADRNNFGVTGIAPEARVGGSSLANQGTAASIVCAANALSAGDLILIQVHRRGPNSGGGHLRGHIAIEWWPDDFAAIRYAVGKGIIVVEPGGTGWEDLDAAIYDTPRPGFPASWKNPFRLSNPLSGAVMTGAGDPPSGTHGRSISGLNQPYVDRARSGYSNWGSRIDAQGWGWEVTTTGFGDLQGGADRNRWYTDRFNGSSSSSAVVAGALISAQGAVKARGMPLMTSWRARSLLHTTGSPQQSAPGRPVSQRIGRRPNLKQLIPAALKSWVNGVTIRLTYATCLPQDAWAFITGYGWRRIRTGAPDGVTNVFEICCHSQAAGTKVNVLIDDRFLYAIVQN